MLRIFALLFALSVGAAHAQETRGTSPLSIAKGGTNAATATAARTSLGLAIGTNVEAWDADLDCLAALATTGALQRTGTGTCVAAAVTLANGGLGGSQAGATANQIPVFPGSGGAAVPTTLFGTGVQTALGNAAGATGGFPVNIAQGTITLNTTTVASGTCGAAQTATATGTATTDEVDFSFNGDPTGTTGYTAGAQLSIVPYPTANTVNIKICNNTGSSISPGAITLNWRVRR